MFTLLAVVFAVICSRTTAVTCASSWGQCGGVGFSGPTCCGSGFVCTFSNTWYSQCLPVATKSPTRTPTLAPSAVPTTFKPTSVPSRAPTTNVPSQSPTLKPTTKPTTAPTIGTPTLAPTFTPTATTPTAAPSTGTPTLAPTLTPTTITPTAAPTSGTAVPTSSPTTGSLCKSLTSYTDFSDGTLGSFLVDKQYCSGGVTIGPSSADATKKSFTLKLKSGCGASNVVSNSKYAGGYFETVVRLGGQGTGFDGLVYAWFLKENEYPAPNTNEMDFEWLGNAAQPKNLGPGKVQSNWFYNGVGAGKNEKFHWFNSSVGSPVTGFYKYGLYWDNSKMVWYVNDGIVRTELATTTNVTTSRPMQLYFSLWGASESLAGSWAGNINFSSPQVSNYFMEFQYVKICTV